MWQRQEKNISYISMNGQKKNRITGYAFGQIAEKNTIYGKEKRSRYNNLINAKTSSIRIKKWVLQFFWQRRSDEKGKRDKWCNESEDDDDDVRMNDAARQTKNYTDYRLNMCSHISFSKIFDLMLNWHKNSDFSSIFGYSRMCACVQNFNYKM